MRRARGGLDQLFLPGIVPHGATVESLLVFPKNAPDAIPKLRSSDRVRTLATIYKNVQGHALQRAAKKRRDAETEDTDPDVSAAADAATDTVLVSR